MSLKVEFEILLRAYRAGIIHETDLQHKLGELEARAISGNERSDEGEERNFLVPFALIETVDKVRRAQHLLAEELQRDPSPEEIATKSGTEPHLVDLLLDVLRHFAAPSEFLSPEEKLLQEIFGEPSMEASEQVRSGNLGKQIRKVLATLTPREEGFLLRAFSENVALFQMLEE